MPLSSHPVRSSGVAFRRPEECDPGCLEVGLPPLCSPPGGNAPAAKPWEHLGPMLTALTVSKFYHMATCFVLSCSWQPHWAQGWCGSLLQGSWALVSRDCFKSTEAIPFLSLCFRHLAKEGLVGVGICKKVYAGLRCHAISSLSACCHGVLELLWFWNSKQPSWEDR
jgi:hypothetical protein